MVIWVVEFSRGEGGGGLDRFLPKIHKNQLTQWKLLKFENWCSGELSKIGHHFCNKVVYKSMLMKNVNNKNVVLIWYIDS